VFGRSYTLPEFSKRLGELGRAGVTLPAPVGNQLAVLAAADVKAQFYGGKGPDGVLWPRLQHPRPAGGDKPLLNTGVLANSYHAAADGGGVTVASAHPGAGLQLSGGTVRPRRAKALAIPLTREAARYASPRRFPRKLFVWKPPKGTTGHPALAEVRERKGKQPGGLVKHYLLVPFTKHKPHPLGFSEAMLRRADAVLLDHMERGTLGG
jgi:hypothetical protein